MPRLEPVGVDELLLRPEQLDEHLPGWDYLGRRIRIIRNRLFSFVRLSKLHCVRVFWRYQHWLRSWLNLSYRCQWFRCKWHRHPEF
jgi:hypothetical protein